MVDLERIRQTTQKILNFEFPGDREKARIYLSGNKLNFSCPYCKDSKNSRKKRGNLNLDFLFFKCYNGGCGEYKNILEFFSDWGFKDDLNMDEIIEISTLLADNKKHGVFIKNLDIDLFFEKDINQYLVPRKDLMYKLGLKELINTPGEDYVRKRYQKIDERFAWDERRNKLYLFNLNLDKTKILGLQTRRMDNNENYPKYLTYRLKKIWETFMKSTDEDFLKGCLDFDPISVIFGIYGLRFDEKVTLFEGPMDSWLFPNSCGLCSIENRFPFDINNKRYFLDFDKTGVEKALELLSKGEEVFLWRKFLKDNGLTLDKKWDLNSLVVYLRDNSKKVTNLENYFSSDKWDIVNI